MQQNTHIVLIAIRPCTSYKNDIREIHKYNGYIRKICYTLAGTTIPNVLVGDEDVHTHILNEYPILAREDVKIYSMNDFMELNNNEEYNPDDWFMSYVYSIDWNTNH